MITNYNHYKLQDYACFDNQANRLILQGNKVPPHPFRTEFQRDRDRIIHSKSFRRLEYKTQVYLTQHGDHLRTRLTHSLEVSQIARTIAMQLGLNVDLVEAISLGHDVGHTPFGHAAERRLSKLLEQDGFGKFKHNMQSVKILCELEKKYDYDGLSLTIPVLEGILKHTNFQPTAINYFSELFPQYEHSVTLEGQVVELADEIAQITHDMDDYLRLGFITLDSLLVHDLFKDIDQFTKVHYSKSFFDIIAVSADRKKDIIIGYMVDYLVTSLIEASKVLITDSLRAFEIEKRYITFGKHGSNINSFKTFFEDKLFSTFIIKEMDRRGIMIVETLYKYYKDYPSKLPPTTRDKFSSKGIPVIADYISGMTDRYAIEQYESIIKK